MADKYEMYKQIGKLPLAKDSNTDTSDFVKRRLTLSGVKSKDSKLSSDTSTFLKRRLMLSGGKKSASSLLTKVVKKSPIGKAVDTVIKVGAGVGAGYEYAKSKFKKDEVEKDEVEKKSSGGMIIGKGKDYIKDLL